MHRPRSNPPCAALALLVGLAISSWCQQASADPPAQASLAVVRLPSHGASATVIATEPGKTWILGCGHAFQGRDRSKPIVIDVPTPYPQPPRKVGTQLLKVNYEDDLSLVLLAAGPVDYVCPVAALGHPLGELLSVGYDEMQLPAKVLPTHVVQLSAQVTYTRERPWHGRSGGALIDAHTGSLVGVVQGYEVEGQRRGMYVSHQAILRFLAGEPWKAQPRALPVPPDPLLPPLLLPHY